LLPHTEASRHLTRRATNLLLKPQRLCASSKMLRLRAPCQQQFSSLRFDAVFYPGGHGPLWDLANDKHSIQLIESAYAAGKPVAFVCHAPGVLLNVKAKDGTSIVKGKHVTGFSNAEEDAVQLTSVVPFLVEDELKRLGGLYAKGPDWSSFVLVDGNLITGQNPASSVEAAHEELQMLAAAVRTK